MTKTSELPVANKPEEVPPTSPIGTPTNQIVLSGGDTIISNETLPKMSNETLPKTSSDELPLQILSTSTMDAGPISPADSSGDECNLGDEGNLGNEVGTNELQDVLRERRSHVDQTAHEYVNTAGDPVADASYHSNPPSPSAAVLFGGVSHALERAHPEREPMRCKISNDEEEQDPEVIRKNRVSQRSTEWDYEDAFEAFALCESSTAPDPGSQSSLTSDEESGIKNLLSSSDLVSSGEKISPWPATNKCVAMTSMLLVILAWMFGYVTAVYWDNVDFAPPADDRMVETLITSNPRQQEEIQAAIAETLSTVKARQAEELRAAIAQAKADEMDKYSGKMSELQKTLAQEAVVQLTSVKEMLESKHDTDKQNLQNEKERQQKEIEDLKQALMREKAASARMKNQSQENEQEEREAARVANFAADRDRLAELERAVAKSEHEKQEMKDRLMEATAALQETGVAKSDSTYVGDLSKVMLNAPDGEYASEQLQAEASHLRQKLARYELEEQTLKQKLTYREQEFADTLKKKEDALLEALTLKDNALNEFDQRVIGQQTLLLEERRRNDVAREHLLVEERARREELEKSLDQWEELVRIKEKKHQEEGSALQEMLRVKDRAQDDLQRELVGLKEKHAEELEHVTGDIYRGSMSKKVIQVVVEFTFESRLCLKMDPHLRPPTLGHFSPCVEEAWTQHVPHLQVGSIIDDVQEDKGIVINGALIKPPNSSWVLKSPNWGLHVEPLSSGMRLVSFSKTSDVWWSRHDVRLRDRLVRLDSVETRFMSSGELARLPEFKKRPLLLMFERDRKCADRDVDATEACDGWAKAGECSTNPKYMCVHCRCSCDCFREN